jgi:hypothetical protein
VKQLGALTALVKYYGQNSSQKFGIVMESGKNKSGKE